MRVREFLSRQMRLGLALFAALATGALLAVTPFAASPAAAHGTDGTLVTVLTGAAEVPAGSGDPDGIGVAVLNVTPASGQICYALTVAKLAGTVTSVHVHNAPKGQRGPDVFDLNTPTNGFVSGCTTVEPAVASDISGNSHNYYVEVHTTAFPAGAIRGQL